MTRDRGEQRKMPEPEPEPTTTQISDPSLFQQRTPYTSQGWYSTRGRTSTQGAKVAQEVSRIDQKCTVYVPLEEGFTGGSAGSTVDQRNVQEHQKMNNIGLGILYI